jgi:uncharacterized protein
MRSAPWAASIAVLVQVSGSGTDRSTDAARIHDIQGAAHVSPFVGKEVRDVEGVVTQPGAWGFYMQDLSPDDDEATSEGIRVSSDVVLVAGDLVRVTGLVREVRPGCLACSAASDAYANLTTTEIEASSVVLDGRALGLPEPISLGSKPGERRPPSEIVDDDAAGDVESGASAFDPTRDGIDFYESLEGMRVRIDEARAVGPTMRFSGRAPELVVVANGGAGFGPFTSRGGLLRRADDDNPERVIASSGRGATLPDLNVGDTFTEPMLGVIDYSFGNFKLIVANPPLGLRLSPPRDAPLLPSSGPDELTVATFNVRNLALSDAAAKFDAVAELVVRDLAAPDVVVLQEIQDDSGSTNDGTTDASSTYSILIDAIAALGGPMYAFRDVPPEDGQDGGEPGANIRVGLLIREDRGVVPADRPGATPTSSTIVYDVAGVPELSETPGRIDPLSDAFVRSRKPLVVQLGWAGRPIFVVGVHFNSQIGDLPLFGRFQPPERPTRVQRTAQAVVVRDFVRQILDIDPEASVLVLGDFNDGAESPSLALLRESGLSNLIERVPEAERYTHIFQGNAETVDQRAAPSPKASSSFESFTRTPTSPAA